MTFNARETIAGAFFIAVGLVYGTMAVAALPIGTLLNMGPGYFPVVLSGLLILLGTIVIVSGRHLTDEDEEPAARIHLRSLVMLALSIVTFALTIRGLGMFVSVALTALLAALSSNRISIVRAAVTSVVIAAFCVLLFGYGLRLRVPALGPWLSF